MGKLRDLPLRYRLSLPFLILAFCGTFALVGLSILSQRDLIGQQERARLYGYYRAFHSSIKLKGRWAVSLASSFARNPEVAQALAQHDRQRLIRLCDPAYRFMKENYGISQFNFQTVPPRMFLRLQKLHAFGEDLSHRKTILDALARKKETYGLEKGLTGYGIRGVAPVFYKGQLVGTVEIGFGFDQVLLQQLQKQFGIEISLLEPNPEHTKFHSIATTFPESLVRQEPVYAEVFQDNTPRLISRQISGKPYCVLVGTVHDYEGKTVALVELCVDRGKTLAVMDHYLKWMVGIGILGLLLSVGGIYGITSYFMRPIAKMVRFARSIAEDHQVQQLDAKLSGELGVLANALNDMLVALGESRRKILDYTNNLEHMVHLRTRALRESEEKYRTLVENVPLVVYRMLDSGKVIFINHYIEDLLGDSVQQVLQQEDFWREKVWYEDRPRVWPLMERCLKEGQEFKAEYRVQHRTGKLIFVQGHALPILDETGKVETVDGFLVNTTDRYRLQQQIIQTEELRTLSEVSARLAHEIRNPLVAAGGFARRLLQTLPAADPHREQVQIIVQEVARLEKILEKTLAYLKPFEVVPERSSLNELLEEVFAGQEEWFRDRAVTLVKNLSPNLPVLALDRLLFKKVLESLLRAVMDYCLSDSKLEVETYPGDNAVHLEIIASVGQVSEDDIEHFFYPFTSRSDPYQSLDLPLAKMIIHKHRGLIHLRRSNAEQLILHVTLPQ